MTKIRRVGGVDEGHGQRPVPLASFGRAPHVGSGVPEGGPMRSTVLGNGVQVLSEEIGGVRSASVGVWVRTGSAHEPGELGGASHLLEHMVFKGTRHRSARDLALSLESLGGSLDAYTSREHTSYQARVLDEHLPEALDVLRDLVLDPLLRDEDLALERDVVLEEIAQVEDMPDDQVFDLHADYLWDGHPYGRSILGTADSVGSMPVEALRRLHAERYLGRHLVVAAAGNVRHEDLVELAARHFGTVGAGSAPAEVPVPDGRWDGREQRVQRDTAQVHVVLGRPVPRHADPVRYPLALLSAALGGGMSSRLFQRVREELALCYSVYTFQSFYRVGGISGVYVGTRPATADRAVDVILEELRRISREGLPPAELEQTKRQVKGQITLSLESTSARLYRLASFALHDERFMPLDELLSRIDAVTAEQVLDAAARYYDPEKQRILRLGPA